ncbi:MAG: heme NO-binding domain-containing protein [Gemmatimonadota bacterium]
MHGVIFSELRKYVDTRLGSDAWNQLLTQAQLGNRMYLPIQEYPDGDMVALVGAASEVTGLPKEAILEDFGEFIAPSLLGLYRTLVKPEWKTLDLLENTEQTIHSVVRARNPGAKPAQLQAVRTGPDVVDLTYNSERQLCAVAKGILKGIAAHYDEELAITEKECMHDGADACRMEVRVVTPGAAPKKRSTPAPKKKRQSKKSSRSD